jgi:heme exporter protein D
MNLAEFFGMGGYAVYVWPSYGLALLVLYLNYIIPIRREQRLYSKLFRQQAGKAG